MAVICPTVLATTATEYKTQVEKVAHLGHRLQIDLTDSVFAPSHTIGADEAWWPAGFSADMHLMYKNPAEAITRVLPHKPHLIIVHAESDGDFKQVVQACRQKGVKVGVALLPATGPHHILSELDQLDHVLIFSGDLGSFGGHADLSLLEKVKFLKTLKPGLEIGWDGGINNQNVAQLVYGGVDVLNVGGYIQNAEDPRKAYNDLVRIAEETGTT